MENFRILSLDGGGIRGIMTAVWLNQLEQKLGRPLKECFDLVAGTSTGSLLACGVSMGLRTDKMISLYRERGKEIFPGTAARLWSRATRVFSQGPSAPKYDGKGLEGVLKEVFEDGQGNNILFGDLQIKPTLVVSYDTLNRQSVVFKNTNSNYAKLPIYQVCKASSSAPTYFPAHIMRIGNADIPLIDGGVVANNPTACAIAEAIRINNTKSKSQRIDLSNFVVASFGTGELTRPISIENSQEWGAVEWAIPIIDVLFDGSTDAVDYIARQITDENKYFRFQCRLDTAYDDMDNADSTNINALIGVAQNYLTAQGGEQQLDRLVSQLKA